MAPRTQLFNRKFWIVWSLASSFVQVAPRLTVFLYHTGLYGNKLADSRCPLL